MSIEDRTDEHKELATPMGWLRDLVARNYLFVGLASLLVIAATLFLLHGHPLAALPVVIAAVGLLLRSPMMPGLFLVVISLATVLLTAWMRGSSYSDVPSSHFRLMDIVLVGAMLTYFACQFRLLSLTLRGMPSDAPPGQRRKSDHPLKRPSSIVPPEEMGRMFAVIAASVVIGQMIWLLVAELNLDFSAFPPVRLPELSALPPQGGENYKPSAWPTRFLLLTGLVAIAVLPTTLVFWYWRISRLGPAEARMILLDTQWRESRRELNRQEKWRAWGFARRKRKETPQLKERQRPKGSRRSLGEALAMTCGMLFLGGVVAFIAAIVLVRYMATR